MRRPPNPRLPGGGRHSAAGTRRACPPRPESSHLPLHRYNSRGRRGGAGGAHPKGLLLLMALTTIMSSLLALSLLNLGGYLGGGGVGQLQWKRRRPLDPWNDPTHVTSRIVSDDLTEGKSCVYDPVDQTWDCRDCSYNSSGAHPPRASSSSVEPESRRRRRDDCPKLRPRNVCPPFPRQEYDVPPRRSSYHDPTDSNAPLRYVLTHFGMDRTYEQVPCAVSSRSSCFDLTRCRGTVAGEDGGDDKDRADGVSPMAVYAHGPSGGTASRLLDVAVQRVPSIVRRVSDPDDACLLVVSCDSYPTHLAMRSSPHWNEGRNHYAWSAPFCHGSHGDQPFPLENYQRAALHSQSMTNAHVRLGYDTPVWYAPGLRLEEKYVDLDVHRKRRVLLSFKGAIQNWEQVYWQHRYIASEYWTRSDDVVVDVKCTYGRANKEYDITGSDGYIKLLANSTFVFAPGGGSVQTFRFAEALSLGAIPVVTSELVPPFHPEVDWEGCLVRVSEVRVVDLPDRLRSMTDAEVRERQKRCKELFDAVMGLKECSQEKEGGGVGRKKKLWRIDSEENSFITAMKVWSLRVRNALREEEQKMKFEESLVARR